MKRLLTFVFCFAACALAHAQVPGTLSYQGILVNVAGNPVADGNHTVTFNFHKTITGGVPTFARGPFTVSTFKGLFTLVLGTGTPATVNDPLPVLASDPNYIGNTQYYLELVADNVILSPRVSLSSMPYAFTAQNANTMNASGLTGTVSDARLEPKVDITELTVGSSAQLAVSTTGNITKINNVATSFPATQGTANTLLSNDGSGNLTWISPATSTGGWGLTGNSGTGATSFIGTTDNKPLIFSTNTTGGGGERMRIDENGKVHLKGNGTTLSLEGTDHSYLEFYPTGPTRKGWIGYGSANDVKLSLANEDAIAFITANGTTAGERMRIDENGNVGIGTTTPLGKLDVLGGPIAFGGTLSNVATRPGVSSAPINNEIWAYKSGVSTADDGFMRISAGGGTSGLTKSFIDLSGFSTVPDMHANITFGTAGVEKMRIDPGGNVGIGTTTPISKLDVAGDVRLAQTTAPTTTTDKLYNIGGSLYWNGAKLFNGFGDGNTFLGHDAGKANTTGVSNHFVGLNAGLDNTTGTENHFEGLSAGAANTSGSFNHFSGDGAGRSNTTANGNHFVGSYAGFSNTTGASNYFSGQSAGGNNTTASNNHFVGFHAGEFNTIGIRNDFQGFRAGIGNTTGNYNYFHGYEAGFANTTSSELHFDGYQAGSQNTTGTLNHFSGFQAGTANTTGFQNTAVGYKALTANTFGQNNTAIGKQAMISNTTGNFNVAVGSSALTLNVSGTDNTAVGVDALNQTTGSNNTAVGRAALGANTSGANNSALGTAAGSAVTTGSNLTLIGYNAQPSSASAINEITLGNSSVTSLRANVTSITSLSDRRDKKNISDLSLGLDFLMTLRPRQFNWDKREWYSAGHSDGSKVEKNFTAGFISQELDQAQTSQHAEWLNLVLKNNPEKWEATYGNLLPVMVKAIQEQQKTIDSQEDKIKELEDRIGKLNGAFTAELDAIKKQLGMEVKSAITSSSTAGNK